MTSVLQDWVMELPLREQGVMLAAVRSCDLSPKPPSGQLSSVGRMQEAATQVRDQVPVDARELAIAGAFMRLDAPDPSRWKASELGHYPQHWYSHLMHAFQVVGNRHPVASTRLACLTVYTKMVSNLHLYPEPLADYIHRLSEDRIASGTVVS